MVRKRMPPKREADRELISKGEDALKDFDESQALHVPAKRREAKLISIRLPMGMIRQLREVASRRGDIGYQQLIKLYLSESLLREEFRKDLESFASELLMRGSVFAASCGLQTGLENSPDEFEAKPRFRLDPNVEVPFTEGHIAPVDREEQVG